MGRPSIQVDKDLLKQIIDKCESEKSYTNRTELFTDVALKYSNETKIEISPSVVYLRVNEYKFVVRTPKGKKGHTNIPRGERVKRGDKFAADTSAQKTFELLRQEMVRENATRFLPVLKKAMKGSRKAIDKLMCLTCANYETNEIKHCQCIMCPLHPVRAYK
jgi:hypothetical protein